MKKYPKGAIKNINELLEHSHKLLYHVSIAHSRGVISEYSKLYFDGVIGTETESCHNEKYRYYWYEYAYSNDLSFKTKSSLMDTNVIENHYNDWYLFHTLEDAREYLGLCTHCGSKK